tara:strand:+ start:5287 stop:6144 length:858 start_codon:yes stop_codon:yes gene_type:complete
MKGIVLAGGAGTRLHPMTLGISKQLIPVYDKPMIYYPISTLIYSGIREILIISTPYDTPIFKKLLGNGSKFGCIFKYVVQKTPNGLAQAFVLGEEFIGDDKVCLILGDNIFQMKISQLEDGINVNGGLIFGYQVRDPERYGVVEFSENNLVLSIEEKPKNPRSNYAIPGLYFYDNSVVEIAKTLKPSKRGEYEITDLNRVYLNNNQLQVKLLGKGSVWLDTGTVTSLQQASNYVQVIEERQGRKIGCIEEAAFRKGFIDKKQLLKLSKSLINSGYGKYLQNLIYR